MISAFAEPGILPLRLDQVSFDAGGVRLLDRISAELRASRRAIVLGPNGAGKSLLLRLCHGLLQPTAGRLCWGDAGPALPRKTLRRHQAMVFQRPVLLRRSALANVAYALALQGVPRRRRRALALAALESFGLGALEARPARVLSGGEQQRLALARAWATGPSVLFLDEPTASLDVASTRAVEDAVNAFHAAGTTVVMTTHDLAQAKRLADDVLFLCGGRLLEQSPAAAFFAHPHCAEAKAFLRGELVE